MVEKEPFGYQRPVLTPAELEVKLERVDELVNQLIDTELAADEFHELEDLLVESPEARQEYVGMMQLHADLIEYYNPREKAAGVPVLGSFTSTIDMPAQPQG